MNLISYDQNSSTDMIKMPETISSTNINQLLIEDIDKIYNEKHLLSNQDDPSLSPTFQIDDISSIITQKQKSMISIYDNNFQQQSIINCLPLVGIIGQNKRSQAFIKRLLLSGFPKPILCDRNSIEMNSNNKINYLTYETFYQLSPTIILITDNSIINFQDLFQEQNKQQLIIDAREIISKYFSKKSPVLLPSIPGSYRAFSNLSNWEIENGTERIGVAIEQSSPLNLIKFIYDLNCFSRGIYFLDQYLYNNQQIKSFHNCLFPFISTIIIFSLCFILSIMEHTNDIYNPVLIYRQASSITASTSLTLLALLFLIRPILELTELIHSMILKQKNLKQNVIPHLIFIQRWLQSRRYLVWYSLSFALLHLIFLIFSKIDFHSKLLIYGFFFGIFTLIFLFILSFVYFPWISERLLWNEYHFLTSYLGPFCLLIAFIHVFIQWKSNLDLFNLKFFSMILPFIVLILRFIIYGIIYPIIKLIQWIKNQKELKNSSIIIMTNDISLLP